MPAEQRASPRPDEKSGSPKHGRDLPATKLRALQSHKERCAHEFGTARPKPGHCDDLQPLEHHSGTFCLSRLGENIRTRIRTRGWKNVTEIIFTRLVSTLFPNTPCYGRSKSTLHRNSSNPRKSCLLHNSPASRRDLPQSRGVGCKAWGPRCFGDTRRRGTGMPRRAVAPSLCSIALLQREPPQVLGEGEGICPLQRV